MKKLYFLMFLMFLYGCDLVPAIAPVDWPQNDVSDLIDTNQFEVVIDTINVDTTNQDTCQKTPFITGYIIFDTPQDSVLWKGGTVESYDLEEVLSSAFPNMIYRIYRNDMAWMVIVEGTSDHKSAQFKVQCKVDGAKWYMGWSDESILPVGVLTADEYSELVVLYPLVKRFNFVGTSYDSLDYVNIAWDIVSCGTGGVWADFRHVPFDLPNEIFQAYEDDDWEYVLH